MCLHKKQYIINANPWIPVHTGRGGGVLVSSTQPNCSNKVPRDLVSFIIFDRTPDTNITIFKPG